MLQPPMGSKDAVYIYLKLAVITVHFTNKVQKSMWNSDISHNFQFGLQCHIQVEKNSINRQKLQMYVTKLRNYFRRK